MARRRECRVVDLIGYRRLCCWRTVRDPNGSSDKRCGCDCRPVLRPAYVWVGKLQLNLYHSNQLPRLSISLGGNCATGQQVSLSLGRDGHPELAISYY